MTSVAHTKGLHVVTTNTNNEKGLAQNSWMNSFFQMPQVQYYRQACDVEYVDAHEIFMCKYSLLAL